MQAESLLCNVQHSAKLKNNKNDELNHKSFTPGSPTAQEIATL